MICAVSVCRKRLVLMKLSWLIANWTNCSFYVCMTSYNIVIFHHLLHSIFLFYLICADSFVSYECVMKNCSVVEGWAMFMWGKWPWLSLIPELIRHIWQCWIQRLCLRSCISWSLQMRETEIYQHTHMTKSGILWKTCALLEIFISSSFNQNAGLLLAKFDYELNLNVIVWKSALPGLVSG